MNRKLTQKQKLERLWYNQKGREVKNQPPFLLVAIVIVIIAMAAFGGIRVSAHNELVSKCEEITANYQRHGITPDDSICPETNLDNLPSILLNTSSYQQVVKHLESKKTSLEREIANIKSQNQLIIEELNGLGTQGVDTKNTSGLTNLTTILALESNNYSTLVGLLNEEESKVVELTTKYKSILDEYRFLGTDEYSSFLNNYQEYTQRGKNLNYQLLEKAYKNLQTTTLSKLKEKGLTEQNTTAEDIFSYKYYTEEDLGSLHLTLDFSKGTTEQSSRYPITNISSVDERIYDFAKERGYKEQPIAIESNLEQIKNIKLQPDAATALDSMIQQAKKEGVSIEPTYGFRSPKTQTEIFLSRLHGTLKKDIDETLQTVAPPGCSRHHTGYAVDLEDSSEPDNLPFKDTKASKWLSRNNYLNAKKFGFLPSYPKTANHIDYGPNPESWEYVYVGENYLKIN